MVTELVVDTLIVSQLKVASKVKKLIAALSSE